MSHETIYTSLFVQSRGALKRELTRYLRTRRMMRLPRATHLRHGQGRLTETLHIRVVREASACLASLWGTATVRYVRPRLRGSSV